MSRNNLILLWLAVLAAWAISLLGVSATVTAPLDQSIKLVAPAPTTGAMDLHKAYVTRTTLTADESSAPLDFEVVLKMRNFADLQARVNRGERIPPAEMAQKYDPSAADYQKMVDWLTNAGFTITQRDASHMSIFARGTVAQITQKLNTRFARVTLEGKEYTSAVASPSLPADLAALVVGINGLQPHIHPHKHLIKADATSTNPPYFPQQIAQAYKASSLYSSGVTGAGQTIAIVIDTFPLTSDLQTFWQTCGINQSLSNITFIKVVAGATYAAPSGEETLDTEWSSSIAPGAKVRVYGTSSLSDTYLDNAYTQIYNDVKSNPSLGIHQMTMSYGGGEAYESTSQLSTDDQKFAALAGAGVTIFASSGDAGSTPSRSGTETGSLTPENPASDPNVTGVGGTTLMLNSSGNESSEVVWNNAKGASGGGTSTYFSKPSWQTGAGVPPTATMRLVPDLACTADPYYGAEVILNGASTQYGGTSWSSPTVAGFCALINQVRANTGLSSLGPLNPQIYSLIGTANFRDIISGTNETSTSGNDYPATVGYDEATGVGVPLLQALAQSVSFLNSPIVQMVAPGQNASVTVTTSGTPSSYQWQQLPLGGATWSNVSNNGLFSGATTATLTVNGATSSLSGDQFQCVVTYANGTAFTSSPPSTLVVDTPLTITTLAGTVGTAGLLNGTGTAAEFAYPSGTALDTSGDLFVADYNNNAIREITPAGVVSTPYTTPLKTPNAVAADSSNNLYVADTGNNLIRKISPGGTFTTLAASTTFNTPQGVAVDASGNVYVADTGNNLIREITPAGTVTTLAGSGTAGFVNGTGTAAQFNSPTGVAVDTSGNVYVADYNNFAVRKITSAGVVTTYAGQGVAGSMNGLAANALFNTPNGVGVDSSGNVYVTDSLIPPTTSTAAGDNLIRKISTSGVVSTIAGNSGVTGSANGTGTAADFYSPQAITINSAGEIFVADTYNQLIRAGGIAPAIITQPQSQVVTMGQPASFSVVVSGTGPFSYQWEKGGSAVAGATGSTYTIPSTTITNDGSYSVVVSNAFGSVPSTSATLLVVNSQPMAQTLTAGQSTTLAVSISGSGYTYQYLFNGVSIPGATGSSYTISNATSANTGYYSVMITNGTTIVTTTPVLITVNPLLTDTPTMPPWGLVLMAALILLAVTPQLALKRPV